MTAKTSHLFYYFPVIVWGCDQVVLHGLAHVTEAGPCVTRRYAHIRPERSEAEFKGVSHDTLLLKLL